MHTVSLVDPTRIRKRGSLTYRDMLVIFSRVKRIDTWPLFLTCTEYVRTTAKIFWNVPCTCYELYSLLMYRSRFFSSDKKSNDLITREKKGDVSEYLIPNHKVITTKIDPFGSSCICLHFTSVIRLYFWWVIRIIILHNWKGL